MGVPAVGDGIGVRLVSLVGLSTSGAEGVWVGKRAGSVVAVKDGTGVDGENGVNVGNKVGVTIKMEDGSPPLPVPKGMARTHEVNKVVMSARNMKRRNTNFSEEQSPRL